MKYIRSIFSLLFIWMAASDCGAASRPNIVFILADDMRPDAMSVLGHPIVQTPNLDRLASEGSMFTRALVGYPICHVSRAEILTGCCAFQTGVQYRGKAIEPGLARWPETLRQNGYRTWFSGKWHNDGQPKHHGFESTAGLFSSGGRTPAVPLLDHAGRVATGYTGWTFKTNDRVVEPEKGVGLTPDTDRFIAEGAIGLIRQKPIEPFFLQISFTGPHDPRIEPRGYERHYDSATLPLPKNFASKHSFDHGNANGRDEILFKMPRDADELRAELAVYYAVIANIDEQLGKIFAALHETGAWENTIVIFSSDHGLALGSHGLTGKQNMYEHTIGVPLVMCGPGIPKGKTIHAQCYLRDLFPTTCELIGTPIPTTVQGRSLVPIFTDQVSRIYDEVFSCFTDTQRMIRDERWKLVWYPKLDRYQLFDVVDDPDELYDRIDDAQHVARFATMKRRLETWLNEHSDPIMASR